MGKKNVDLSELFTSQWLKSLETRSYPIKNKIISKLWELVAYAKFLSEKASLIEILKVIVITPNKLIFIKKALKVLFNN